jgi:mRNA interferase MazF
MVIPEQGDLWWAETETKRRPVLVVTRSAAIPVLTTLLLAPVTRTIRHISTEISLGPEHGLPEPCVATFDNLLPIRKTFLTNRIGSLGVSGTSLICDALEATAGC